MVDVSPKEAVVLPGRNVSFLCRVGVPLQYCRVELPGSRSFNLNTKLSQTRNRVTYYGAGLSAGQCGFTIEQVTEEDNGKIKCYLGLETESQEAIDSVQLTVAKAPKSPELDLSRGTDSLRVYKIHDVLQASCVVRDGRPVANISWYLDDEPIVGDGLSMPTIIDFAKEDLHSKVQNLTRTLQPSDNGKLLKCVASHPALPEESIASRQLDVKYAPIPLTNPIDKFGFELGKPGMISIEIDANPKPQIEWEIRGQKIREGTIDNTGRIEAESAQDLGRGHYVANLRIAAINKQDTETQFILTAYNDMGSQDYTVLISTSAEPEGVDLGVGTIVLIVMSILFVMVIVFVVIFARVKGKWCFSGSSEARNVAESSDTESADARPKEKRNILKLSKQKLNIFKKNDKVGQEIAEEARKMETDEVKIPLDECKDEKDGIVYAELDLVSQNLRPVVRNDDDKTEYAEIVYTPSEDKDKKEEKSTG
ncbi:PREDICTED: fasciclin-3 isoform X2 [Nicrophorus vespilloides]|uniref:Fasciclin-3 isoform X2 n=1 Tax=Nicrophorus vespilloides TaxID=110193 RepID=A0ABM1NEZ3_NICVS|nr:PREDICTED: fasciclin-3 isoform X2 [Nicrophorus vespilloides]